MADKNINILLSVNAKGVTTGLDQATQAIKQGGAEMAQSTAKASEAISSSQKTIQQEYRATFKAAQILAEQQGTNSAAFLDAARQAGEYKNKLGDVTEITKAMASDTPVLTAALGVGQGLAGAFAAAQGAMALFGSDSKMLQETMLKVQGSIALVSGLQALGGLSDSFTALSATIKLNVVPALASLGTAIMANPIFAGAAILTAAVAALYNYSKAMEETASSIADAKKEQDSFNKSLEDYILTDKQRQINAANDEYNKLKEQSDLKIKIFEEYANRMKIGNQEIDAAQLADYRKTKALILQAEEAHVRKIKEINEKGAPKIKKAKSTEGTNLVAAGNGSYLENIASKGLPAIATMKGGLLELKAIGQDAFLGLEGSVSKFAVTMDAIISQVGGQLIQLGSQGFQQFAEMAGAALAGEQVDFGAAASQMLGSIASTLSAGLIAMGIPLLFSGITAGQGAALIAAGGAMGVVAGALKANQKPGSSGSGGGGGISAPNNSAINYNPSSSMMAVSGLVRGQDIIIASANTQRSNQRVR